MIKITSINPEELFIELSAEERLKIAEAQTEDGSRLKGYVDYYRCQGLDTISTLLRHIDSYIGMFSLNRCSTSPKLEAGGHIAQLRKNALYSDTWTNRLGDKRGNLFHLSRMKTRTEDLICILESEPYDVLLYLVDESKKQVKRRKFWAGLSFSRNKTEAQFERILSALDRIQNEIILEKRRSYEDLLNRLEIPENMRFPLCDDVLYLSSQLYLTEDQIKRFQAVGLSSPSLEKCKDILQSEFFKLPSQLSRNITPDLYTKALALISLNSDPRIQDRFLRLALFSEDMGALKTQNLKRDIGIIVVPKEMSASIPKKLYGPKFIVSFLFKETYRRYHFFNGKQWLMMVFKLYPDIIQNFSGQPNQTLYLAEIQFYIQTEISAIENEIRKYGKEKKGKLIELLRKWQQALVELNAKFEASKNSVASVIPEISHPTQDLHEAESLSLSEQDLTDCIQLEQLGSSCPLPLLRVKELMEVFRAKMFEQNADHPYFKERGEGFLLGMDSLLRIVATHRWAVHRDAEKLTYDNYVDWLRQYFSIYAKIDDSELKHKSDSIKLTIKNTFHVVLLNLLTQVTESLLNALVNLDSGKSQKKLEVVAEQKEKLASCIDLMKEFHWHGFTQISPERLFLKLKEEDSVPPVIKAYTESLHMGIEKEKQNFGISSNPKKLEFAKENVSFFNLMNAKVSESNAIQFQAKRLGGK